MNTQTIYLELPRGEEGTFHIRLDAILVLEDYDNEGTGGTFILVAPGHYLRTSMSRREVLRLMEKEVNR